MRTGFACTFRSHRYGGIHPLGEAGKEVWGETWNRAAIFRGRGGPVFPPSTIPNRHPLLLSTECRILEAERPRHETPGRKGYPGRNRGAQTCRGGSCAMQSVCRVCPVHALNPGGTWRSITGFLRHGDVAKTAAPNHFPRPQSSSSSSPHPQCHLSEPPAFGCAEHTATYYSCHLSTHMGTYPTRLHKLNSAPLPKLSLPNNRSLQHHPDTDRQVPLASQSPKVNIVLAPQEEVSKIL
jgi:hypothetical protein